jgi:hypothetical protein
MHPDVAKDVNFRAGGLRRWKLAVIALSPSERLFVEDIRRAVSVAVQQFSNELVAGDLDAAERWPSIAFGLIEAIAEPTRAA